MQDQFRFAEIKMALNGLTSGCREDMHEPDESGVTATVVNPLGKLDNAFGDDVSGGEIIIRIAREGITAESGCFEDFNLADLIALAKKADVDI